jgi:3'(2'), 5'-bisphosphate nucleotidase
MQEVDLYSLLDCAINASIKAGDEIMKIYNSNFEFTTKEDNSPLTIADKNSNAIIEKALKISKIPFLSEEGKDIPYNERKKWDYLWIVDPLDGTKEFIKKNGEFTVNIALVKKQKPILGVIYVPCSNELYYALEGLGAFKATIDGSYKGLESLLKNSSKLPANQNRSNFIVVGSRSHMSTETQKYFDKKENEYDSVEVLAVGSSLKICMVAEGKADVYPRYAPTMEWDTAAGHAIANMAGFKIIEYNSSNEIIYNKEELLNPWFLVS